MRRREHTAHKPFGVLVPRALPLRSRVPGNGHARVCSRGGESDFLIDCNLTASSVRSCVAPAVRRESGVEECGNTVGYTGTR